MGGVIDWTGVAAVAELVGAPDAELLIRGLVQLRDHLLQEAEDEAEQQRRRRG